MARNDYLLDEKCDVATKKVRKIFRNKVPDKSPKAILKRPILTFGKKNPAARCIDSTMRREWLLQNPYCLVIVRLVVTVFIELFVAIPYLKRLDGTLVKIQDEIADDIVDLLIAHLIKIFLFVFA